MQELFFIGPLIVLALWFAWIGVYGFGRGSLAVFLRVVWLLPLILAFFPETRFENLPRTIALKPIHVLVDDSKSVKESQSFSNEIDKILAELDEECIRLGCLVKKTLLSEIDSLTKEGFTPLSKALDLWLLGTMGEPWVLISDGGDFMPTVPWSKKFKGAGLAENGKPRGFILGSKSDTYKNVWLENVEGPIFSFVDKPLDFPVVVHRDGGSLDKETIQLQVLSNDKALSTLNATFAKDEKSVSLRLPMQALSKGQHLLSVKALPSGGEKSLWDNVIHRSVTVLPNTIGILHLLGAPSWGGRFLRRYLKSEPKYDLISFFILRDPGDIQLVNERELSLIPFPVDRLFNEELPNFHLVILQNFALYQFLEPAYNKNLVKFVKNGGGLLFIGGPRALQVGDYNNSFLSSILPFTAPGAKTSGRRPLFGNFGLQRRSTKGPYFDPDVKFNIGLADPDPNQRDLANVFDDWETLLPRLQAVGPLKGLHHTEKVKFEKSRYTPLLEAITEDGSKRPLAVASYPGKGRALWLFTDAFHRMALEPGPSGNRQLYQEFMGASLTWLLREELRKPVIIRDFLVENRGASSHWKLNLLGPALKYLDQRDSWQMTICGQAIDMKSVESEKFGRDSVLVAGVLSTPVAAGERCDAIVQGNHPAFGNAEARIATVIPDRYSDADISASVQKLESLAEVTGADLQFVGKDQSSLLAFLDEVTGRFGVSFPSRYRTVENHYWVLDRWWFWGLLLALPLEVVVRRWPQLTSMRRRDFRKSGQKTSPKGALEGSKSG